MMNREMRDTRSGFMKYEIWEGKNKKLKRKKGRKNEECVCVGGYSL